MRELSHIGRDLYNLGRDLYNYFLSIYPENSTVSLCMSEKLFYQFVNEHTNTEDFIKNGFLSIDIKDAYACLAIAVYQSTLFVRKNIIDTKSYNNELCKDLSVNQNSLQKWYKNHQEIIWTDIVKKLFQKKTRDIILPNLKSGAYRYVQYPSSQFIINSDQVDRFDKVNLNFNEYSKRFFCDNQKYYDSNKENFNITFYNYSEDNLNYIAKRIIYSFVVNDINFIKNNKQLFNPYKPQQFHPKIVDQLHLRIENNKITVIPTKNHINDLILFLNKHFYKLFIYDNKNKWWDYNTSRKIDSNHKYGIFMKKTFFELNNDSQNYIKEIYIIDDYFFIEVNENSDSIKEMCNIYHLIYNLNINFSFICGMRNKDNEYYYFSLPTITLNKIAKTLYINNYDVHVSSDTYNLNDYKKYITEGINTFKINPSKIYTLNIKIKKQCNLSSNILGRIVDKKDYSISYSYPYHIQGLFVSNTIPQIISQEKNNYSLQYFNPIFRVINKNLKSQLQKGKINVI